MNRTAQITTGADSENRCPACGLTRRELYAQGQMGCARCYGTFRAEVEQALQEIHGHVEHIGKTPVWHQEPS